MNVGIAYARPTAQIWRSLTIAEGATVRDVIEASGLLDQFPELDLETNKVGIFGIVARLDKPVKGATGSRSTARSTPTPSFWRKRDDPRQGAPFRRT